jgi:glycosyltransferase involved in cell wall biosynthesis
MGIFQRSIAFTRFMLSSALFVLKCKKHDLIIATSTPLTVGFPALTAKFFRKTPFIFEVRDLWPEVPIQMGAIKNKAAKKLLKYFEKSIYKNASHIIALSPGMYDGVISTGIPKEKVSMIPNMSKIDVFRPRNRSVFDYNQLNWDPDTFKIVYFGSMGIANGMDYILDAAKLLITERKIEFIIIGNGSTKNELMERAIKEEISNLVFINSVPLNALSEMVNLCDISLVTFANIPILATNSPNKFFDSLSAGKPIIVNSPGWTKDIVERYECGVYANPADPESLAIQIKNLFKNQELVKKMGVNSRILAEKTYDKSILCDQFYKVVKKFE